MQQTSTTRRASPYRIAALRPWLVLLTALTLLATAGCSDSDETQDSSDGGGAAAEDAGIPDGATTTDAGSGGGAETDDGLHPVLSHFRVEDSEHGRIYFDSSEPITATTTAGFIVTGKTITGIRTEPASTTGHYVTVEPAVTFWDNHTIRYEGGSDLEDTEGNGPYPFTLRYVENLIPEPDAPTFRYVTATASGGGDGTSDATAWTIAQAGANAEAGQTVWIEAGDYGNTPLIVSHEGTAGAPLKFVGYTSTPGDGPSLPRTQDTVFDAAEMPFIHSTGTTGAGVDFGGKSYIVLKNIQVEGYQDAVRLDGNVENCLVENVYAMGALRADFFIFAYDTRNVRVKGCYASNASGTGIRVAGVNNLIDDLYACSRGTPDMDYYISLYGGTIGTGNIVLNSAVVRDSADTHGGHGISVKAGSRPLEHTLIEDCTVHGLDQAVELRHHQTRYTIVRNVTATGTHDGDSNLVTFRDGTSDNTVEDCLADGVHYGVRFTMNAGEDLGIQAGGHHNRIVNTVFRDSRYAVEINGWNGIPLESTDNEFVSCTFHGAQDMFGFAHPVAFGDSNRFTNCNIVDVLSEAAATAPQTTTSYSHCNFWGSWTTVPGTGNVDLDPQFVDAAGGDFHLEGTSPVKDLGMDLADLHYDLDGVERVDGQYSIGAYE